MRVIHPRAFYFEGLVFDVSALIIFNLLLQSSHPLLQVELETLVGLGEQSVHRVRETLVVLFVHLFSLSSLKGQITTDEDILSRVNKPAPNRISLVLFESCLRG